MFSNELSILSNNILQKWNEEGKEYPIHMDIVFEGGAFNGYYEYGVALLLKEFERKGLIKVNRISGVSIGSIIGVLYLIDSLELYEQQMSKVKDYMLRYMSLRNTKELLEQSFNNINESCFNNILSNKKLYITYFNVRENKIKCINKFKNKNDIMKTIFYSCHIPFLSSNEFALKNKYIDGIYPYIFNHSRENNKEILYVSITNLSKVGKIISINNQNHFKKIYSGIHDVYKFMYYGKKTKYCSYMKEWSLSEYICNIIKKSLIYYFIHIIFLLYTYLLRFDVWLSSREYFTNSFIIGFLNNIMINLDVKNKVRLWITKIIELFTYYIQWIVINYIMV